MADDDNGIKPADQAGAAGRRQPPQTPATDASEWTVSDRRGPLNAAGEHDEIERIVPSSEIDAEGTRDVGAHIATRSDETPLGATTPEREDNDATVGAGQPAAAAVDPAAPIETHTSTPEHPVRTEAPRRSFVPIAAGIVVGALIGAGSAAAVYTMYPNQSATGSLEGRVAALEQRPDPTQALDSLKARVDALDGTVKTLAARKPSTLQAAPTGDQAAPVVTKAPDAGAQQATNGQASDADAALQKKLSDLQATVQTLDQRTTDLQAKTGDLSGQVASAKDLAGKVGGLSTALADVQKQTAGTQSGLDAVQTEQKTLAGRVGAPAMAVVADSLVQQIDSGQPYAVQTDAAASLGADPAKVAVLRENAAKGVPSSKALAASFAPLADPIVASEHRAPDNAGFFARLKAGMMGLVSVRRADTPTGTDIRSRVALIQSDLEHDDPVAAFTVWSALPADAKARSDAWGAKLKTSVEAMNAARSLQRDAIAALAAKRS